MSLILLSRTQFRQEWEKAVAQWQGEKTTANAVELAVLLSRAPKGTVQPLPQLVVATGWWQAATPDARGWFAARANELWAVSLGKDDASFKVRWTIGVWSADTETCRTFLAELRQAARKAGWAAEFVQGHLRLRVRPLPGEAQADEGPAAEKPVSDSAE